MPKQPEFSVWRKIAMSTWRRSYDPLILSNLEIDAEKALRYVADVRAATGEHVTMMHLVGRSVARIMATVPGLNGRIVGGRFMPSETVDIFFTVSLETKMAADGAAAVKTDLSGTKVVRCDEKRPWEIAHTLDERARMIRENKDPQFKATKQVAKLLPAPALRAVLQLTTFITEDLQLPVPFLGLPARPFGSFLVTNVGTFGLDQAFAAMPPVCHTPGGILVGTVRETPVVRDGEVVARPMLPLSVMVDHRFIDGYQGAMLWKMLREYLEDPAKFDPVPAVVAATPRARRHSTRKAA